MPETMQGLTIGARVKHWLHGYGTVQRAWLDSRQLPKVAVYYASGAVIEQWATSIDVVPAEQVPSIVAEHRARFARD